MAEVPPQRKLSRLPLRLAAVAAIVIVAALAYRGLHDRFFLPQCDSERAKQTLAEVLKQLKLEPLRYEPLITVSQTNSRVACTAALPLPDGSTVAIDYSFYWQGSQANMKYSVARK
jgi:hypothetical protein